MTPFCPASQPPGGSYSLRRSRSDVHQMLRRARCNSGKDLLQRTEKRNLLFHYHPGHLRSCACIFRCCSGCGRYLCIRGRRILQGYLHRLRKRRIGRYGFLKSRGGASKLSPAALKLLETSRSSRTGRLMKSLKTVILNLWQKISPG